MVESLLEKVATWMTAAGPEGAIALFTQGSLVRNLADFPFPSACSDDERRMIEERVLGALESCGLLGSGHYCASSEFDAREAAFLAERRLVPYDFFKGRSHGGVFISDDQSLSIVVNGLNHLCITHHASGLAVQEAWVRLNAVDDLLAGALDFAFAKQFGYMTSTLGLVGTGLKLSVLLHLPVLLADGGPADLLNDARERRQMLYGLKPMAGAGSGRKPRQASGESLYYDLTETLYSDYPDAHGDLYLLTNQATLGYSEEEIVFHLRHTAADLIAKEKEARSRALADDRLRLEDRVARALGVAANARLLTYAEAVLLLSAIRLGVDLNLVSGQPMARMNELLFASQGAHIKMKRGHDCDEWTLSVDRANLFRFRFGQDRKGL